MKHIALLLALVLAGCGGGGGGGDTASPNPAPAPSPVPAPAPGPSPTPVTPDGRPAQGTFVPAFLDIQTLEGESAIAQVALQESIGTDQALNARIELPNIFEPINRVSRYWNGSSYSNAVSITLSKSAPPGTYTGTIKLMLCRDAPENCQQPFLSTPWVLPYKATVHSQGPRLITLAPLAGQPKGWTQAYANASSSSTIETTENFDPSKFSVRWRVKQPDFRPSEADIVAEGGIVAIKMFHRGILETKLHAFSEESGKTIWQQPIWAFGGLRGHVLAQGKIFTLLKKTYGDSDLNAYDAATGALVFSESTPQDGSVSIVTDGTSIYARSPMIRWDALSGKTIWRAFPEGGFADQKRPVRAGPHIYAFNEKGLQRYSTDTGLQTSLTPAAGGAEHLLVSDKSNNLYSAFNLGGPNGQISIGKFSTANNTQLWEKKIRGYSVDMPAVDSAFLYLVTRTLQTNKQATITAYSTADGKEIWSKTPEGLAENVRFVVAGNLIFVSSFSSDATRTYALNRSTGEIVWSFPIGGSLALSENGTLYIAETSDFANRGSLTAINLR